MNIRKKCLCAAVAMLVSCASQATIIDQGDYLTDTATGLDWLDVTTTSNLSYNDVSAQLGVSGALDGWRMDLSISCVRSPGPS